MDLTEKDGKKNHNCQGITLKNIKTFLIPQCGTIFLQLIPIFVEISKPVFLDIIPLLSVHKLSNNQELVLVWYHNYGKQIADHNMQLHSILKF